jgi:hypothetical protein
MRHSLCADFSSTKFCGTKNNFMAEIHVQAKKQNNSSASWVWIVIGLLIAAAVIYFITRNKDADDSKATNTPANTTSFVDQTVESNNSFVLAS